VDLNALVMVHVIVVACARANLGIEEQLVNVAPVLVNPQNVQVMVNVLVMERVHAFLTGHL